MIKGLPEKLKEFRLKYKYSQAQVAQRLDISPSIISAYETGERTPITENLLALAYLYHCSTDYLLGESPENSPVQFCIDGLTDKQQKIIRHSLSH